jgi:hypothetical protein
MTSGLRRFLRSKNSKIQNFVHRIFDNFRLVCAKGLKTNGLIQFCRQRMTPDNTSSVCLRAQQLRSGLDCSCKLTALKAGTKFTVSLRPNNQIHKSENNNLPRQIYERLSRCSTLFFIVCGLTLMHRITNILAVLKNR